VRNCERELSTPIRKAVKELMISAQAIRERRILRQWIKTARTAAAPGNNGEVLNRGYSQEAGRAKLLERPIWRASRTARNL